MYVVWLVGRIRSWATTVRCGPVDYEGGPRVTPTGVGTKRIAAAPDPRLVCCCSCSSPRVGGTDPWRCPRPASRSPARSRARRAPRPGRRPCPPASHPAHRVANGVGVPDPIGVPEPESPTRPRPIRTASETPRQRAHGDGIVPATAGGDETDATESEEDQDVPAWLWWVLAGLALLGAALAAILVPRARRRSTWDTDLATQQDEVTWFARELVPAPAAGGLNGRRRRWLAGRGGPRDTRRGPAHRTGVHGPRRGSWQPGAFSAGRRACSPPGHRAPDRVPRSGGAAPRPRRDREPAAGGTRATMRRTVAQ